VAEVEKLDLYDAYHQDLSVASSSILHLVDGIWSECGKREKYEGSVI
jgi:hypothetical protein